MYLTGEVIFLGEISTICALSLENFKNQQPIYKAVTQHSTLARSFRSKRIRKELFNRA